MNGINEEEYYFCSTVRGTLDMCDEEGKYYKKKRSSILPPLENRN